MKKIFMLLSIVLVGNILINSCIYDKVCEGEASIITPPDPGPDIPSGNATKKTFYFRFLPEKMNSATVNTYAGPYINGSDVLLVWGATESFGVFLRGSDGTSLFSNKKFDYVSTTFYYTDTITTNLTSATGYGYIPYVTSVSGSNVAYTLNSVQDQSSQYSTAAGMDEVLASNVFAISTPSTFNLLDNETTTCTLNFKGIFSLLRFQVKASNNNIFSQQRISKVKLYVANDSDLETPLNYNLAGSYSINIINVPGTPAYTGPDFGSTGVNTITSSVTGGGYITESTTSSPYVWFVINPIKIKANEKLVSVVETTSGYKIISRHNIPELQPNTTYFSTIEANESNTVSNIIKELTGYGEKTSNCYIVSSAGTYRMYTKQISGTALIGNSVDWVWASKEGGSSSFNINELIDTSSITYSASGGYVDFRVGSSLGKFTKGNVILALKDASGNIVWTWHIWLTDKPEDIAYDSFVFMDRNIGALSTDINNSPAVDTYGFVYQWGRKDPFFGGDGVIYDEATSILETARMHTIVNTSYTWNNYVEKALGGNFDYSIKHPMSFIYNEGSGLSWRNDPADWLSTRNSSLWSATSKTDYDPCPDGYRVPAANEVNILHFANVTTPKAFDKDSEKYWKFDNSSSVSYWPAAGMRQGRQNLSSDNLYGAQLKYSGTNMLEGQCYYWTSSPFSVGGTPLLGASYRIHTVSNLLYSADDYGDNADAYPIRCVKE